MKKLSECHYCGVELDLFVGIGFKNYYADIFKDGVRIIGCVRVCDSCKDILPNNSNIKIYN